MTDMRAERKSKRRLDRIAHAVAQAVALDDRRDRGIEGVRKPWEEVVLDLVVEAAQHPREELVARAEVDCRLDLVHGPWTRAGREISRRSEARLLDTVRELKRRRHHDAGHHGKPDVRRHYRPPRIQEQWNDDRPADEERLPAEKADPRPAGRRPQGGLSVGAS